LIGNDSPAGLRFFNGVPDLYAGGRGLRSTTALGASDDLAFVIQEAVGVPEPAGVALLVLGGFLVWRRKQTGQPNRGAMNHVLKSALGMALTCGLLAGNSAFGAIVVNSTAPTGSLAHIAQPNGGADVRDPFYTAAGTRRAIGTTFDLNSETAFSMNAITMKLRVGTAAQTPIVGSSWVVSVFTLTTDSDTTPDAYLNVAGDKRTAVGTMPTLTFAAVDGQTVDNFVTFVLPFSVSISAGQQYGFMVDFASANANNALTGSGTGWVGSSNNERSDAYGLVQATAEDGPYTLWSAGGDDIIFWLGSFQETAVPEPSTVTLLALGGLLAWRQAHRP